MYYIESNSALREKSMIRIKTRYILILSVVMVTLLALLANGVFSVPETCIAEQASTDEYMWYYLPHATQTQPKPMEKAPYIKNYNVIFVGDAKEKIIYLTFDDCPDNENIPAILDVLEQHQAPAAFFMTELFIRLHPKVIQRIVDDGNLVCNHTSKHVSVTRLTFEEFKKQLQGVENAYYEVTGHELPKFFRPPQGLFSQQTLEYAEELGYTIVFWSFRYGDWDVNNQLSNESAFQTIIGETHPGEIALFHCQSKTNVSILDSVLTAWEKQGYRFGSIEEILINNFEANISSLKMSD